MKKLFSFIFLAIALISCNKASEEVPPYVFDVYRTNFMTYYAMGGATSDTNKVLLEYYPDGKLKKRTGDIISVPVPPYPYPYAYCDCIVDTFSYSGNQVIADRIYLMNDGEHRIVSTMIYFLDQGRVEKITSRRFYSYDDTDTTFLFYGENESLDSTITLGYSSGNLQRHLKKVFSYDGNGNLVKVDGVSMGNYRTEEYFSGYDHHENPLKDVIGLEEVFYRTLSENNFTDYSFKRIYFSSEPDDWSERHWDFEYDGNDLPLFY